jgi:dTDP-4-dehydrorhamnose reductase
MRVLIFGGNGMLGHKLVQGLSGDFEVWCTLRGGFDSVERFNIFDSEKVLCAVDVADPESIRRAIEIVRPAHVINAVGVIKQLPSSKDVIQTLTINSIFPHRLSKLGEEFGFRLVTISTDCVFAGTKGNYSELDVADAYDLYGKSKNLGEVTDGKCVTVRTSIIGRELDSAHSLVEWFFSNRGSPVKGFAGAIYTGFPTVIFADIIRHLITDQEHLHGLYHISSDPISKYDLLQLIRSKFALDIEIQRDEEFRIDRSLDSSKYRTETGFHPLAWESMVEKMAEDPTPYAQFRR